jgi:hypothetical protein
MFHPASRAALAAAVAAAFGAHGALAQEGPGPAPSGFFSFTFENDIVAGTDRDYTNGVRASYTSTRNELPLWGRAARRNLGWMSDADDWYVAYAVGQNIFTPPNISDPTPPPDERPYAGFLYVSAAIIADRGDRLDTIALDLGVVGPASLARQTQSIVHNLVGSPDPKGWDFQLRNEPGVRLLYERKERFGATLPLGLLGLEADAIPNFSLALGNVDTSAAAGLTVRLGDKLRDDYGPPRIQPAIAGPGFFGGDGFGWQLFASAEARAVGRNIFLEGNTFRDSRSVEPRRLVGTFSAGVGLQWNDVELTYTQTLRTSEYDGQGAPAVFGSITLNYRF